MKLTRNLKSVTPQSTHEQRILLKTGMVVRYRIATDECGRFLEFGLLQGSELTYCRFGILGRLGEQLVHGKRYAVLGTESVQGHLEMLEVSAVLSLGHVADRATRPVNRFGYSQVTQHSPFNRIACRRVLTRRLPAHGQPSPSADRLVPHRR